MKKIVASFFLFLLLGCATTEKYDAMVKTWVGAPEERLLLKWGPPMSTTTINESRKVYHYKRQKQIANTSADPIMGGVTTTVNTLYCDTNFIIERGIIVDYSWNGNNCVSY